MGLSFMDDEELASPGVAAGMSHRQGTSYMLAAVDFTVDRVAGPPGTGHALGSFP
jgi:hypothetical protein